MYIGFHTFENWPVVMPRFLGKCFYFELKYTVTCFWTCLNEGNEFRIVVPIRVFVIPLFAIQFVIWFTKQIHRISILLCFFRLCHIHFFVFRSTMIWMLLCLIISYIPVTIPILLGINSVVTAAMSQSYMRLREAWE